MGVIMTTIKQALNECKSVSDLKFLMDAHTLEAKIGALGGRRIVDANKLKSKRLSGSVSVYDIEQCLRRVSNNHLNTGEAKELASRLHRLDKEATSKLESKSGFHKKLTEVRRTMGNKFERETFKQDIKRQDKVEKSEEMSEELERIDPELKKNFKKYFPKTWEAYKSFLRERSNKTYEILIQIFNHENYSLGGKHGTDAFNFTQLQRQINNTISLAGNVKPPVIPKYNNEVFEMQKNLKNLKNKFSEEEFQKYTPKTYDLLIRIAGKINFKPKDAKKFINSLRKELNDNEERDDDWMQFTRKMDIEINNIFKVPLFARPWE
jgi:hypothetical protein